MKYNKKEVSTFLNEKINIKYRVIYYDPDTQIRKFDTHNVNGKIIALFNQYVMFVTFSGSESPIAYGNIDEINLL